MNTDDFLKDQYRSLRDEIRESKAHIFWLLIVGIVLVMSSGYLAAEHPSAFANAAIPFLLLALMLAYISEQNNIARAGRYLREVVEPRIQDLTCWEHWLESKHQFREVDHAFVVGFAVIFLIFLRSPPRSPCGNSSSAIRRFTSGASAGRTSQARSASPTSSPATGKHPPLQADCRTATALEVR